MNSERYVSALCRLALADRNGQVAVLGVYMDKFGIHDDLPVVTVGAYFGRTRAWRSFTKEWNATKEPIKIFHAADCANFEGEFKGWKKEDRDAFVANLLPVLTRHPIVGLAIGINLRDFEAAMKSRPDLLEVFGNPYTACFRWSARMIADTIEKIGLNEAIAFIHENNSFEGEARDAFSFVEQGRHLESGPMSLTFGSKQDFVPLQAADILAYESNKLGRDPGKPWRRALQAINPGNTRCTLSFFTKKNMDALVNAMTSVKEEFAALGQHTVYGKPRKRKPTS